MARLTHLQRLEAESIRIFREAVAESEKPVMLYSVGKDSAVMLHLAVKAFYPSKPPFPLLHVDTTWKFQAMYDFRDKHVAELGLDLLVYQNPDCVAQGHQPLRARLGGAYRHVEDGGPQAGRNNQQRRAAKARAKRRAGSGRGSHHPSYDGYDPTPLARLTEALLGSGSPGPVGRPEQAAGLCFESSSPALWQYGWQPYDLSQVVRRRLGPLHHEVLVAMLAQEIRAYARSTVDIRWHAQLADLGAVDAPVAGVASSAVWAERVGGPAVEALVASIELLALLLTLPRVAVQLPPPGTARAGRAPRALSEQDERALARVRALLAKTESTTFAEEAEALSAKAQELMSRHSLHRAGGRGCR